jgi:hypothetical protein
VPLLGEDEQGLLHVPLVLPDEEVASNLLDLFGHHQPGSTRDRVRVLLVAGRGDHAPTDGSDVVDRGNGHRLCDRQAGDHEASHADAEAPLLRLDLTPHFTLGCQPGGVLAAAEVDLKDRVHVLVLRLEQVVSGRPVRSVHEGEVHRVCGVLDG